MIYKRRGQYSMGCEEMLAAIQVILGDKRKEVEKAIESLLRVPGNMDKAHGLWNERMNITMFKNWLAMNDKKLLSDCWDREKKKDVK